MQPPVVEGLTQLPEDESEPLGGMVGQLAKQRLGPETAETDLRAGMAAFLRAAQKDPRLEERISRALDVLEGNQQFGANNMGGTSVNQGPKIGPMAGNVKTPI